MGAPTAALAHAELAGTSQRGWQAATVLPQTRRDNGTTETTSTRHGVGGALSTVRLREVLIRFAVEVQREPVRPLGRPQRTPGFPLARVFAQGRVSTSSHPMNAMLCA
jgi:hypothetical protein